MLSDGFRDGTHPSLITSSLFELGTEIHKNPSLNFRDGFQIPSLKFRDRFQIQFLDGFKNTSLNLEADDGFLNPSLFLETDSKSVSKFRDRNWESVPDKIH